jgi:oligoribonuclease NrnB/cAMP/cGMP phosphodiesterase (DHH superfamily)
MIKQLSHTDLDGVGACIPVKLLADRMNKEYVYENISYDEITDTLLSFEFGKVNFITDLNFQLEEIELLLRIVEVSPTKQFFYYDHHQYSDEEMKYLNFAQDNFDNFKFEINIDICGAQITYNHLEKHIGDENLKSLINVINIYDTWKVRDPLFNEAFLLDKVFWYVAKNHTFHEFMFRLEKNNWILPEDFKQAQQSMIQNKLRDYKEFEENGMILKGDHIFVIPSVEWINDTRFDYPEFKVYFGFNPNKKKVSVRVADNYPQIKEFITSIVDKDKIISIGGHQFAFGITLKEEANIIEVVKEISEKVEKLSLN